MTNRQWLKQEINQWVDDGVITDEEGKELSARYKHAGPYPYREAFFFLAAVCILGGLFFLGAGLWNGLTQDQRFLLAMGPLLVSFLLMLAVVLVDKKISDPDVMEPDYRGTSLSDEILGFGGVSDSDAFESVDKIGKKAGLMAKIASETRTVPAKTWHHRVPAFIREAAATLHGFCLLGAFWMVSDSFQLSSDMYSGLALCALLLLLMCIVTSSGGLGILYMACSVGIFYTAPERGWPEIVSWIFMMIALLLMARMLYERRDKALVLFSWGWAVGIFSSFSGRQEICSGRRFSFRWQQRLPGWQAASSGHTASAHRQCVSSAALQSSRYFWKARTALYGRIFQAASSFGLFSFSSLSLMRFFFSAWERRLNGFLSWQG